MDEPLPRLLLAAESAGVSGSISALGERESWVAEGSEFAEEQYRRLV